MTSKHVGRVEALDASVCYTEVRRKQLSWSRSIKVTWKRVAIFAIKKRVELKHFIGIKH